jgi:predicted secreted protein
MKTVTSSFPSKVYWIAILTFIFCATSLTATAQNQFILNDLDEGQLILSLSASEQVSVQQDKLNVMMQYTSQGRDSTALQDEVNTAIREAKTILEATSNIDYSIQQYHVYTIQSSRPSRNDINNPVWRAQQSVQMNSMNSEALLVVTARLQAAGLTVSNLYYSLSSERYEEVSDSLMNAALLKLQARADETAATLNKRTAELVEVNINGGQNFFGARMAMAEIDTASMSVPVAEPGETQVNMSVSARALLSP